MKDYILPQGWRYIKLKQIADVIAGVSFKPDDVTQKGIRILRSGNIQNGYIEPKSDDVYLNDSYYNINNTVRYLDNCITSSTGSIEVLGKCGTIFEKMENTQIGAFLRIVRSRSKEDALYLSLILHTPYYYQYIRQFAKNGTSINNIKNEHLENFEFPFPADIEKERISKLYYDIEKKIVLNTRMNAELEAMAKQLYDYWFVQFDFPDENGNPYKSSGGKMVYNPTLKREIPAGWEVSSLSSVIGKDKSGDWGQDIEKGCYKIKVNCIRGADLKDSLNAPIRFINEKNVNRLLSEDDIIVEISGGSPVQATGRTLYVSKGLLDWYNKRLTCSNFCRPLVLSDNKDAPYFYYTWNLFYDNGIMFNFEGKTSGIKNLLLDMILGTYWYFPPSNINNRFCDIIKKNLKLIDSNKTEIENLKSLRDSLLPMLMNGQVTVE